MSEHTPTPWESYHKEPSRVIGIRQGKDGYTICGVYADDVEGIQEADADFIVTACNSHDALVEALKRILARHTDEAQTMNEVMCFCESCNDCRAALKLAGVDE